MASGQALLALHDFTHQLFNGLLTNQDQQQQHSFISQRYSQSEAM